MTPPTLAMERTALAWRRTSLGAAGCALLFAHQVTADGWPTNALPMVAAVLSLLLSFLGWFRGRALHHGRVAAGRPVVTAAAAAVGLVALIAFTGLLVTRLID
ncbi:DUF202 domain-containing protein [Nocardia sp. NPDC051833]|uniref:DUF202 domain-containing protein n=1 Tax=Nocardia sp. NPDC051833 TaxID=3155674 RepID=UPI0034235E59